MIRTSIRVRAGAQRGRSRTSAIAAALSLCLLVSTAAAACGVPIDDEPRAIGRSTVDPEVDAGRQTPTTSDSPGARQVSAYFMRNESLEGVYFPVDGSPTMADALAFATGEPPDGFNTSVPSGTAILSAEVDGREATIDLTPDINDISGQGQKQAYAQLVFTALAFQDLDSVRFRVDGKAVDAPTDNGNRASVSRFDYDNLRPDP